jgi:hypothetical protein
MQSRTAWFQDLAESASAICFPRGRISFQHLDKARTTTSWQGQAIFYLGPNSERFREVFCEFGSVWSH